jgi:hypothetical protein
VKPRVRTFTNNLWFFYSKFTDFGAQSSGSTDSGSFPALGLEPGGAVMFVKTVMTVLCMGGIAFYMRFLVALCKERKPRSSGYWVRLRLGSGDGTIAEMPERRKPATRAA